MSKNIINNFILLLLPLFLLIGTTSVAERPTLEKVDFNCLSFVFIPSDYNGQTISCIGADDATLSVSAFGGGEPFTYLWENGETGFQRTNLGPGIYSVQVTDSDGCSLSSSIYLQEPTPINVTKNIINPVSCLTSTDGTLNASGSGGSAPYTYAWDNGSQSPTVDGLGCGLHTVTVSDANGCQAITSFSLDCPEVMQVDINPTSNFGGYNLSCPESADGAADASVEFGEAPYSFIWSSGDSLATATNLEAGVNSLTVTDSKGCAVIAFVIMTIPPAIEIMPTVLSDYEGAAVSCSAAKDGKVLLEMTNGTAPYSFLWSNDETGATANNLSAGESSVTVTDIAGCVASIEIDLSVYEISIQPEIVSDYNGASISCVDATDGAIRMNVAAGASSPPNVTYAWDNGHDTDLLENVSAGTYTLTVTSAFGCTASAEQIISAPDSLYATAMVTSDFNGFDVSGIGENDGSASATATGGTAPYSFLWESGTTDSMEQNLAVGTHNITITDANGCATQTSVTLNAPIALDGFADVSSDYRGQDISCVGEDDGEATAFASGGVPPYIYAWSNNADTETATNLAAGTHTVTITDGNGATVSVEVELFEPEPIELILESTPSGSPSNGTAKVTALGGVSPFSFSWNDPFLRSTETIDQLATGWYRVTATDANGCQENDQIEVTQSLELDCIKENMTITPNGDGMNDFLTLGCIHLFNNEVEIFNRWGNQIFRATDYDGSWNGLRNNKQVPDGGYFYIISVALPTGKRTFKGSLTIIR